MNKFFLILIKFLIISTFCKADVVPGSEWKIAFEHKDLPSKWLVDFKSIVKANGKNNFYYLYLKTSDKTLIKGKNAKTILYRDQIDCNKKLRKPDLAQVYDVEMEKGLTNKGKTLFTKKYNENEKWTSTDETQIGARIASLICLRALSNNFSEKLATDPEEQKKFKEFLKKQGVVK